jgi:hypothetical protein
VPDVPLSPEVPDVPSVPDVPLTPDVPFEPACATKFQFGLVSGNSFWLSAIAIYELPL